MMRNLLIIVYAGYVAQLVASSPLRCSLVRSALQSNLILERYENGTPASPNEIKMLGYLAKNRKVRKLGSGGEAVIYRLTDPNGDSFCVRAHYLNPLLPLSTYVSGMKTLKALERKGSESFRVISVEQISADEGGIKGYAKVSDVKGFTLHNILKIVGTESDAGRSLINLYKSRLIRMIEEAQRQHPGRVTVENVLTVGEPDFPSLEEKQIIIKIASEETHISFFAQNIIVNPDTMEMTIIDSQ